VQKVKIKEFRDEDAAFEYEKARISEIGSENLTNGTLGGRSPGWLVASNGIRGDINVLRTYAKMKTLAKNFPRNSIFDRLFHAHVVDVSEVVKRRGLQWVNSYTHRTGLIIENSR
jgi:hypothetical protein